MKGWYESLKMKEMKKTITILMLVLLSMTATAQLSVWDGGRAVWTHGSGTESDPYLIESARNLAFLSYAVNKGYDMDGVHFLLTTDIDLNGSEDQQWVPIGMGNRWFDDDGCDRGYPQGINFEYTYFRGHFDGGGHFISNIYVEMDNDNGGGLFGAIEGHENYNGDTLIVQNIFVLNGYIKGYNAAGIAGKVSRCCKILNCGNGATIEGTNVGGIVGYEYGSVYYVYTKKCFNKGRIIGRYAGGIVGYGNAEIEECYNEGKVSGTYSGGIFGHSTQRRVHISNCYNTGEIIAEGNGGSASAPARWAAGGIAGFLFRDTNSITNCYNVGAISSLEAAGCILGYATEGSTACENNYYINSCSAGGEGTPLSEEAMCSPEFVVSLNHETDVWCMDTNSLNNGYPILIDNSPQPFGIVAHSNNETIGGVRVIKRPYYENDTAIVAAEPRGEALFLHWSIGGQVVSTDNTYSFTVQGNIELVGNFCANHVVDLRPSDESLGGVRFVQQPNCDNDNVAIVQADTIGDHPFLYWVVNNQIVSYDNPYTFVVEEDMELVAYFKGTGVDEETVQKITISPNPTKNTVNIECENMKGVAVYALDGRIVKAYGELNANAFTLDMSGLSQGIYILRVETQDGAVVNRKVIKE